MSCSTRSTRSGRVLTHTDDQRAPRTRSLPSRRDEPLAKGFRGGGPRRGDGLRAAFARICVDDPTDVAARRRPTDLRPDTTHAADAGDAALARRRHGQGLARPAADRPEPLL